MLKDGGYHAITARQLADYHSKGTPLPDKPVMITFDDGWKNQYEYAAPLLKKYGFVATYFINPQPIGRGSAYMTKDMLVAADQGRQRHRVAHVDARAADPDAQGRPARVPAQHRKQMTLANTWIEQVVGEKPVALCYPYGFYDTEAISRAKAAGYRWRSPPRRASPTPDRGTR